MPKFSLVVATKGRVDELARLISSIEAQSIGDYEMIVIDQNGDDRLLPVMARSVHPEKIRHMRCAPGVSRARNSGMEVASGEIIAFPDDDCWYPAGLMEHVQGWFQEHPEYEILSITSRDESGVCSCNGWFQPSCDLNAVNLFRTSGGSCYFIRSPRIAKSVRFDHRIGPGAGTPYLCGEDTDFLFQTMRLGALGRFEAKWNIGHPRKDIPGESVSRERVYGFGRGMGYVLRKQGFVLLWLGMLLFDFGRAAVAALSGRRGPSRLWYRHGCGMLKGFLRPTP